MYNKSLISDIVFNNFGVLH